MEEMIRDSNRHFVHFFVSSDIFFSNVDEFELLRNQTTVLCIGQNRRYESAGFKVLDISLPEQELMGKLLELKAKMDKAIEESAIRENIDIEFVNNLLLDCRRHFREK